MKDLLQRAQQGDGEAFVELFEECAPALWKAAASVMGTEDAAADMLQETAIKAWRSIPSFNGKSDLATWLTRILLNTCFDELRRKKRFIPLGDITDVVDAGGANMLVCGGARGADACERMDVDRVLSRMSADDRLMLTLFYINDLPISDIATVLDISEGAARTRLSRARSRFKNVYMHADDDVAQSGAMMVEAAV